MKADLKEAWLRDLRSGKFKQGRGKLRERDEGGDRNCCLGVLCETAGLSRALDGYVWPQSSDFGRLTLNLSYDAMRHFGLEHEQCQTLVQMNDTDGLTFNEIADWVEANVGLLPNERE